MDSEPAHTNSGADRLGKHIRKLRYAQGWSIRGLAAKAGLDGTYVSRLERGDYVSPDPRALYKLARALDIEVADLYITAGYGDGRGLPGFTPYLRAKYDLPDEAIAQLAAQFELINERYRKTDQKGSQHGPHNSSS